MWIAVALAFIVGFIVGRLSVRPSADDRLRIARVAAAVSLDPDLKARVQALAHANEPIEAIRLLRETTGMPLAEAKAVVDRLARDPS
jgi:ribosomal protein L7/L12